MKQNKIKKICLSMCMAAFIVVGMAVELSVFAKETEGKYRSMETLHGAADFQRGNASIVIHGKEGQSLKEKSFRLYQIFNAENAKGGESVQYTINSEYEKSVKMIVGEAIEKEASKVTEYEVVDYIQSLNQNQVEGAQAEQPLEGRYSSYRYFVEKLRNQLEKDEVGSDEIHVTEVRKDNTIIIEGLDYGNYVADEISDVVGNHASASLCMVTTAAPAADMYVKSDYPSVIKKIQEDDNQEAVGNNGWNDIADYEIGQRVPYKFESKIPDINGCDAYYYAWHDRMDEALTFQKESVSITIYETSDTQSEYYTLGNEEFKVVTNPEGEETFRVEIKDLKAIVDREFNHKNAQNENVYGQKVLLTYEAVLNDKASEDTGRPGFENDVRLEFSNNPDSDGEGSTGYTPWDTVVCFTYRLNGLKTNEKGVKLEGAKFRLYSDKALKNEVYVKKIPAGYCVLNQDTVGNEILNESIEIESDQNGNFVIFGLDSGTYYLKETSAPDGYRPLLEPIVLEIKAVFIKDRNNYLKGEGGTEKILQKLDASVFVREFQNGIFKEYTTELETDVQDGAVNMNIVNTTGKKLPVTGSSAMLLLSGMGAVLLAGSMLSLHKRAGNFKGRI